MGTRQYWRPSSWWHYGLDVVGLFAIFICLSALAILLYHRWATAEWRGVMQNVRECPCSCTCREEAN